MVLCCFHHLVERLNQTEEITRNKNGRLLKLKACGNNENVKNTTSNLVYFYKLCALKTVFSLRDLKELGIYRIRSAGENRNH